MAGLSLPCPPGREDGHDPLGFFGNGLRRAQPSAPSPGAAVSPAGGAGGSRPFSLPQALTGTGNLAVTSPEEGKFVPRLSA